MSVVPGVDVQAVINAYGTGTTFCFAPGTYRLTNLVRPKSFDRLISTVSRGAIFDGGGTTRAGIVGSGGEAGQHDVTVSGFVLKNFIAADNLDPKAAIQMGWRWTVTDNETTLSTIGIRHNTGAVVRDNWIHHNERYGMASTGDDVIVENNEISFNNTGDNIADTFRTGDSGATKFVGLAQDWQENITIRGNWIHDNKGNGIWPDGNNRNVLIENNTVERNTRLGIFYEVGGTATIRNNIVRNNCTTPNVSCGLGRSVFNGAELYVNNSSDVEVFGNTVIGTNHGIAAFDGSRNDYTPTADGAVQVAVRNLRVHDNDVTTNGSGVSGLTGGRAAAFNGQNTFTGNHYHGGTQWAWGTGTGYLKTWTGWRAVGNDLAPGSST